MTTLSSGIEIDMLFEKIVVKKNEYKVKESNRFRYKIILHYYRSAILPITVLSVSTKYQIDLPLVLVFC